MSDDLWGELPKADTIVHPKAVLGEQATILAQRTSGLLQGDVEIEKSNIYGHDALLRFSIKCPTLQNYTYGILSVYYTRTKVYPCEILAEGGKAKANDENEFKAAVKNILQSPSIKNAIAALLREAQDESSRKVSSLI